jgi:hypothetical protein
MKRLLNIVIVLLFTGTLAMAQGGQHMQQIHAAKIAYITDRIHLTPEQSANFIPLYNSYEKDLRTVRQSFFKKCKDCDGDRRKEMANRRFLEDDLDYQQQVIELKRKYNDSFLKTISPEQLGDLYMAEREFRQILMQRLKQKRGEGRWR